ncbi:MAG: caspase family protein [Theionarchaea archaeon]|nr:caspase family protein [Theionarchaea archaeon]
MPADQIDGIRRYGPALTGMSLCVIFLLLWTQATNPVEGWAVLVEMNDFPGGYTDLPVDFVDIERLQEMLLIHGWDSSHIMVKTDDITTDTIREGIQFLVSHADRNDIVFFYIGSHGGYIRHDLQWNTLFPPLWDLIPSENRVLLIDSCFAGEFLPESPRGYMGIASVSERETAWVGLPEEQLPIIGFVFTYYFCDSMKKKGSIEETFVCIVPEVKKYMINVVYPVFKEEFSPDTYLNLYDPNPLLIDHSPEPFTLMVEKSDPLVLLISISLIVGIGLNFAWIMVTLLRTDTGI